MNLTIPLSPVTSRKIQIGPYLACLDERMVVQIPWPAWMDGLFPHLYIWPGLSPWEPAGYSSWMDGGVWVVRTTQARDGDIVRGASALFLSKDGELLEKVDLPMPPADFFNSAPMWMPLTFGEWVLASGVFLKWGRPILKHPLQDWRACYEVAEGTAALGPDGVLLLSNGTGIAPNGKIVQKFDPSMILTAARKVFGMGSSPYLNQQLSVLGWDRRAIWILAALFGNVKGAGRFAVVRVHEHAKGKSRIDIVKTITGYVLQTTSMKAPLKDGGWVIQALEADVGGYYVHPTRWLFRTPESEEIVEYDTTEGGLLLQLFGRGFAYHERVGLLAIADMDDGLGNRKALLWISNGKNHERMHAFSAPYFELFSGGMWRLVSHGWIPISGDGSHGGLLFKMKSPGTKVPDRTFFLDDLEKAIFQGKVPKAFDIYSVMPWGDWLLVHGKYSLELEKGDCFASIGLSSGTLIAKEVLTFNFETRKVIEAESNKGITVVFSIRYNPSLHLTVRMGPDGSLAASVHENTAS